MIWSPGSNLGRFVRREEIPDDILNGRGEIEIPEPNPPVIQYAGTGEAPTQAPKAIDTTQHPPSTVEDPIQASIERIRARQKPSPQPGASAQTQIDDFMKDTMQDRRYWDPNQKDDAYRDGVTKLWQLSYPGRYQPGSWGQDDHPAVDLDTLRAESRRVLPPGPHKAPGPMQVTPLSAKASAPSGQADQAENAASPSQASGQASGNNSALPQNPNTSAPSTPETRNAFAKGVAEQLGLIPKSPETGVQVAQAIPLPGPAGAIAAGTAAYEIGQQLGDKYGKDIDRALDGAWDAITGGQNSVAPAEPLPNQTQSPADPPDLDDTPAGRPDQSDQTLGEYSLTFPDGSKHKDMGTLPPSQDQSDTLPQGTILNMKDSSGNTYDIDVSGAHPDDITKFKGHLDAIPNDRVRDTVQQVIRGGKLTTEKGTRDKISNIDVKTGTNPLYHAERAFEEIVERAGGNPNDVRSIEKNGKRIRVYNLDDRTDVTFATESKSESPTNYVFIKNEDREVTVNFKTRYKSYD
jgi:hypothetical protein